MNMQLVDVITKKQLRKDIPDFSSFNKSFLKPSGSLYKTSEILSKSFI